MKILYVEDHEALRYAVGRQLRAQGYEVFEAESAEAALALLKSNDIDVLVTDVGLPGTSGVLFAAEARAHKPLLRIVFATGIDEIKQPLGESADAPTVLRKPYSWEDLLRAIEA